MMARGDLFSERVTLTRAVVDTVCRNHSLRLDFEAVIARGIGRGGSEGRLSTQTLSAPHPIRSARERTSVSLRGRRIGREFREPDP